MKNKKGSHAGFAISFVIFIIFVVFILNAVSPSIKVESSKEGLTRDLQESLIENSKAKVEKISLKQNYTKSSQDCTKINSIETSKNTIVKNEHGKILKSNETHVESKNSDILKIVTTNQTLYNKGEPSCNKATSDYEKGIAKRKKLVSKEKINTLIKNHSKDYKGLKSQLGVKDNDFEFVFELNNGTRRNATLGEDPNTEIFAKSKPLIYFDNKANKKQGSLEVRLW